MHGFKLDETSFRDTSLQKKVKSVRWLANFTPKKSGVYTFTIKPDSFSHVFIDGENAKNQEVQLEEGREYSFLVAYFGNPMVEPEELFQLDVQYMCNRQKQKEVEVETFSIPEIASFEVVSNEWSFQKEEEEKPLLDTDNDGIYDEWEINGYTVINHVVYPWPDKGSAKEKEYKDKGYKKYVSNPNESHTAGDPYSDLEKASGALDRAISKVAWDPMIAAYPSITVGMEELVLSRDAKVGENVGKSVSRSTSSSASDSNTLGADASAGWSFLGPSVSVTGHYSHTSTQTVDSSNTSGQDWHTQLDLDTGQSAHMNANVRYYNTGTAPIYNLIPTTNLVLGNETVATVTGQLNQKAMSVAPGQTYPKRHLHGLALNTLDQFSSTPISLNINQLSRLEAGEKLKLETDQFQGAFARRDPAGGQVVMEENEWADYMPQIESSTAGILINMDGNRFMERRIAARDPQNPNDLTPELTLGQALEKAFGATYDEKEKNWYFVDEETDVKHILSSDLVHFVFDKKTKKILEAEVSNQISKVVDMYKIKIRPGMNIQIDIPAYYDDFVNESSKWKGGQYDDSNALGKGKCYMVPGEGKVTYGDFDLDSKCMYLFMMTIKGSVGKVIIEVESDKEVRGSEFDVSSDYKNHKFTLETFPKLAKNLSLSIDNPSDNPIYIDNFSIVKTGRSVDKLEQENKEYAKSLVEGEEYQFPLLDSETFISYRKSDGEPVIGKKDDAYEQGFFLEYDKETGSFLIQVKINNRATKFTYLTWDVEKNKLVFLMKYSDENESHYTFPQRWFFQKSSNKDQIGYNIVNYADRSKVLDFMYEDKRDGTNICLETLDVNKTTQYFQFPQEIK
ncbi:binary toxin-like calcium binding domain-containing protein [Bacillus thuringiensis]|uniref:binary toxin-like calcium binding domain-containing protein n=1 Tax=Bacillus thuringiensis TaxID=1428 RepID=UPI0026E16E95|nr:binary toxin-like calcium binding domain-containing protein [Bacillus thuringiensis]MDO6631803.1 peptidase [Bacillus thuringiensis]MDO6661366.1 peptidase [Bacillus thuringiensis]MDO6701943.1 peptidase [Bacillus thuringiensis]